MTKTWEERCGAEIAARLAPVLRPEIAAEIAELRAALDTNARQITTLRAVIADMTAERAAPANLFTAIDAQAAHRAEREAAACQCAAARRAGDDVSTTPGQGENP
jgi:hypothetical protein